MSIPTVTRVSVKKSLKKIPSFETELDDYESPHQEFAEIIPEFSGLNDSIEQMTAENEIMEKISRQVIIKTDPITRISTTLCTISEVAKKFMLAYVSDTTIVKPEFCILAIDSDGISRESWIFINHIIEQHEMPRWLPNNNALDDLLYVLCKYNISLYSIISKSLIRDFNYTFKKYAINSVFPRTYCKEANPMYFDYLLKRLTSLHKSMVYFGRVSSEDDADEEYYYHDVAFKMGDIKQPDPPHAKIVKLCDTISRLAPETISAILQSIKY